MQVCCCSATPAHPRLAAAVGGFGLLPAKAVAACDAVLTMQCSALRCFMRHKPDVKSSAACLQLSIVNMFSSESGHVLWVVCAVGFVAFACLNG